MLPLAMMGLASGGLSALGGLAGLFGKKKNKNPADAANRYLDQIPGQMQPYYTPYQEAGKEAMGKLTNEYTTALDDPNAIYNKLGQGYKESPGYQYQLQQAMNAANNASASGGSLGTPQHQQAAMEGAQGVASKDYGDYMDRMMGIYGGGLKGEEGMNDKGFQANTDYANMLAQITGQKGMNAFTGQQGQNQANQQNWSNLFSGLAGMGTGYMNGSYMDNMYNKYMGGK